VFELTEKIKELLHGTQPKGPQFTRTVLDILQRENNWVILGSLPLPPFLNLLRLYLCNLDFVET
jgi:hypothetical protein